MPILYFLGGLLVSILFFVADFWLTHAINIKKNISSAVSTSPSITIVPTPLSPIPLSEAIKNTFPDVVSTEFPQTSLLFEKFPIITDGAPVPFYKKTFSNNQTPIFTIYSYTNPSFLESSDGIFTSLQKSLISPSQQLLELKRYGNKSFAIRLEAEQKIMYIVIVFGDRLLGIEYSLDDILRHKSIDAILQSAFPYQEGK